MLMDVKIYEDLLDEVALLRDGRTAEELEARGEAIAIAHDEAAGRPRSRPVK